MLRLNQAHAIQRAAKYTRSIRTGVSTNTSGIRYSGQDFPFAWLRDSCQCPKCVHPSTRQKLHRTSDIGPDGVRPSLHNGSIKCTADGVRIIWSEDHESFYPNEFLSRYSTMQKTREFHKDIDVLPWTKDRVTTSPNLFVQYSSLDSPSGLLAAIIQLSQYGLLFVTGVPAQETSNQTCEARVLAERFGEIRETFYGRLWDVINVKNSTNIAYTNLNLDLHMDLLYFQHPPRYQQLHCLRNRVQGGTSVFVDALDSAMRLRAASPSDFDILASTTIPYHYINAGNHLHHAHPIIELDYYVNAEADGKQPIKHINYSPPFQAPLPPSTPPNFYTALARFVELLEAPDARYEYTLREGDAVLFDNRRVLHARTAFSELPPSGGVQTNQAEGSPNRWLKGCYLEADAVLNRGRVLKEQLGL